MAGYPRKRNILLYLLLFASMFTVSFSLLSVAPDDFASECTQHAEPGSFNNPNQKVIIDTQFYQAQTLLTVTGEDGLWISVDFDMTTGTGTGKVRKYTLNLARKGTEQSECALYHCVCSFACSGLIRASFINASIV